MAQDASEIWAKWESELLSDDYAQKRIASARSKKLTPVKLDTKDFYAYFQGSHGKYETYLDFCPCGDFKRARRPCKHIFRLAMELGLIDVDFQSDSASIPAVKSEILPLNETIDKIEVLSEAAQKKLLKILANTSVDNPHISIGKDDVCMELLNSGIIDISDNNEPLAFEFGTRKNLIENLNKLGLSYDSKLKKSELEAYCTANYPNEMASCYAELISVFVLPQYNKRKMHYYLHRKYESELRFDPVSGYSRILLLETDLPDDDVTEQLIQRGYYQKNI